MRQLLLPNVGQNLQEVGYYLTMEEVHELATRLHAAERGLTMFALPQQKQESKSRWIWILLAVIVIGAIYLGQTHSFTMPTMNGHPTVAAMRQKVLRRGYQSLSSSEKETVRGWYLRDLQGLLNTLASRHRPAMTRGQSRIALEIENAHRLVKEALLKLESEPDFDPTTDVQTLINDVQAALAR